MLQKFRSKVFLGDVPQKETLGLHQKYTCRLLFDLEFLDGIYLPRGDTIYRKNYIYYTSFNMNYITDAVCCQLPKSSINSSSRPSK